MKKILIAVVGAVAMFAVTAASASTLNLAGPGSWFKHVVQQSDKVSANCTNGNVETAYDVTDSNATDIKVLQQYIQGCLYSDFQAVVYKADGSVLTKSDVVRYNTPGLDLVLPFSSQPAAQDISTMRLTIADNING